MDPPSPRTIFQVLFIQFNPPPDLALPAGSHHLQLDPLLSLAHSILQGPQHLLRVLHLGQEHLHLWEVRLEVRLAPKHKHRALGWVGTPPA